MPADIESRLREALQARAAEVEPDPRTWERVQARIRRGRRLRWTAAGALAAAAVAAAAIVLPAALGPRVAFDAPVADQPAGDPRDPESFANPEPARPEAGALPAEEGEPGEVTPLEPCTEPATVAAVWSRQGDIVVACADGQLLPLDSRAHADRHPAVSPAGDAVVFERLQPGADDPVLVHRGFAADAEEVVLGGGALPAFAPDGRLAWVQDAGDGTALIQVGEPSGEPEAEAGVEVPAASLRGLAWDPAGDRLVYTIATPEGVSVWVFAVEGGEHRAVLGAAAGYLAVAFAPDGTLAALREGPGGDVELVTVDRAVLDGAEAEPEPLTRGVTLVDAASDALFLASAGRSRVEPGPGPALDWRPTDAPSWFVGDGSAFYLVDARGEAVALDGFADGASANPAVIHDHEAATVEETRRSIQEFAGAGDVGSLRGLMAADFTYSFGGAADRDEAVAYLAQSPETLEQLGALLDAPHGVVDGGTQTLYVWPRAHALDPAEWTDEDVAALRGLGATDGDIARWRAGEGYTGLRAGIGEDGTWQFLVEGD